MSDTNRTTPAPESATPTTDPLGYEDDDDFRLRESLGLRPIFYANTTTGDYLHPDERDCPAWCEIGQLGYEHEINTKQPLTASHRSVRIQTMASLYAGDETHGSARGVVGSSIECYLQMHGAAQPTVQMFQRAYGDQRENRDSYERLLGLTIDDAADLVTVLQYLIAQADAAEKVSEDERNAFELGRDYERGRAVADATAVD